MTAGSSIEQMLAPTTAAQRLLELLLQQSGRADRAAMLPGCFEAPSPEDQAQVRQMMTGLLFCWIRDLCKAAVPVSDSSMQVLPATVRLACIASRRSQPGWLAAIGENGSDFVVRAG